MIDGFKVLNDIKQFNRDIEEELSIRMPTDILIGVTFHTACMIDRLLENKDTRSFRNKKLFITSNRPYYRAVRKASLTLMEKYDIDISDDDICRIMTFFMDNKNN
jgi:transcriptional regulatory protein LevR